MAFDTQLLKGITLKDEISHAERDEQLCLREVGVSLGHRTFKHFSPSSFSLGCWITRFHCLPNGVSSENSLGDVGRQNEQMNQERDSGKKKSRKNSASTQTTLRKKPLFVMFVSLLVCF